MDRRLESRTDWDILVKYRLLQADSYKLSILKNISASGAMLWLRGDIRIGSKLEVMIEPMEDFDQMNMHLRVVRKEDTPYNEYTGYGCRLEMSVSEMH